MEQYFAASQAYEQQQIIQQEQQCVKNKIIQAAYDPFWISLSLDLEEDVFDMLLSIGSLDLMETFRIYISSVFKCKRFITQYPNPCDAQPHQYKQALFWYNVCIELNKQLQNTQVRPLIQKFNDKCANF